MHFLEKIKDKARRFQKTIVLPESDDERVLKAAKIAVEQNLAKVILLGESEKVKSAAKDIGFDSGKFTIINPRLADKLDEFSRKFYELRKHKNITLEEAKGLMQKPVYHAAMMVRYGLADGFVAGAAHTTSDVAKAAIYCIGFAERVSTISSCFLMMVPDCVYGEQGIFVFADCGIIPSPSPMQLANIAKSASRLFSLLVEKEPRVALLSFSTKGSAKHEAIDNVTSAVKIIAEKYPEVMVDGELQLDAAIIPEVAKIKAPGSKIAGTANVLIFPSLDAGNIGYKLVQRLAKADVIGPMIIGLAKPCSDLSRGCTVEEIVNAVCATAIRSARKIDNQS